MFQRLTKLVKKILFSNKVLTGNIIGVVILKGASLILSFLMTPMYLEYFKDHNILGVWYTLQSILVWILTFDLGLGNGIRNRLAREVSIGDKNAAKRTVSSGYIVLGLTTLGVMITLFVIVPIIDWQKALNTSIDIRILSPVLFITLMGIELQFFFKVVTSILMALRKNIMANALPIITNILILIFLLLPYEGSDNEKFFALACVYSASTIVPLICATIYVFAGDLRDIRPSFRYWDRQIAASVLKVGGSFFIIQLGLLIVGSTNQVLINYFYAGEAVVSYTLYYRLFNMAPMIFTLFTQPVWSEISVKYAKGDLLWIRKIRNLMLGIASFMAVGCISVTAMLPWIFRIWLGDLNQITVDYGIGSVFAIWSIVEVFIYAATCIANGMTKLKCQTIFTIVAAITKIPVTIILSAVMHNWLSVLIAHIIILLPLLIAQNVELAKILKIESQRK